MPFAYLEGGSYSEIADEFAPQRVAKRVYRDERGRLVDWPPGRYVISASIAR